MNVRHRILHSYFFPIVLIFSIVLGGMLGCFCKQTAQSIKPLGDIFLNLMFTAIVPLVFFSVSSAVARAGALGKLGKIATAMLIVFIVTGMVAAAFMIIVMQLFPATQGGYVSTITSQHLSAINFSDQMVHIFTVADFTSLFSHRNMIALIIFSILIGLAAARENEKEKGKAFLTFLHEGERVFMRVFSLIMYYAPIGFFAYFAALVSEVGPKLIENYVRITIIYYSAALIYFLCVFTGYAYLAGKREGIKLFWKNIFLPVVTAVATCSSAASIPANLMATKRMRVPQEIYETAVPLGSMVHKDGSVLGGVLKIAFLFAMFHLNFSDITVLITALGVSLLVGTVMGAIPSGGMLGELLILTVYGFPPSALMAVAAITIIIDPIATMLNVTGNSISSMLITRLVEGKKWLFPEAVEVRGTEDDEIL